MTRQVSVDGLDLVKSCEGLKLDAYRCPAGVWTIGYGHTKGVQPNDRITEPEADKLLLQDLDGAGEQIEQLVRVPLTENQFSSLASFVFNVGASSLASSTLLKRLNSGDYDAVPVELGKWVKATNPKTGEKVTLPGLVKRRSAEGQLWLKADSDDPFLSSSDMPQQVYSDEQPSNSYVVVARNGLRLRGGPSESFDVQRVLDVGTKVFVVKQKDQWAAVDLEDNGLIDGWVCHDFLRPKNG